MPACMVVYPTKRHSSGTIPPPMIIRAARRRRMSAVESECLLQDLPQKKSFPSVLWWRRSHSTAANGKERFPKCQSSIQTSTAALGQDFGLFPYFFVRLGAEFFQAKSLGNQRQQNQVTAPNHHHHHVPNHQLLRSRPTGRGGL
mmetsp:Transcript_17385/g.36030  ORF Transcript_17385/g.36030 Transcript_17385/m.36030 type:complete len:144 (+) Transcript_17385:121-552(+)